MYALKTTDIPPRRHGGSKGGENGEIPTGSAALDIHFEESKLDLSLRRFASRPPRPEDQNPSTISGLHMPAGVVSNTDPQQPPKSGRQQRKRLMKKTAERSHKQTCDDLSRAVRDPDKHHKHFTEDYPKPQKRTGANDTSPVGGEVACPKVRCAHCSSTTKAGEIRKPPQNNSNPHKTLREGDVQVGEDVGDRSTSKFRRGLARVKSMSAILVNSGRVPQVDAISASSDKVPMKQPGLPSLSASELPGTRNDSMEQRSTQAAEHVPLKRGAASATTTPTPTPSLPSQPPPTVGFLTDEAMQHDRVRFANAFRSRIEARRVRELEKATSAASLARIRGGWGGRQCEPHVPDWAREMDYEMRRMRDDPRLQPFRRVREHRGDDGSYHYQEHFNYDSRRDGPVGRAGRHGSGGLGGRIRGLFGGGRPRNPPDGYESDSEEDDLPRGLPLQGPPGMGGQGMRGFGGMPPGMGPMGIGGPGGMGQLGMGGFGRIPPGMGPPGGAGLMGMGPPHMGRPGGMPVGMAGRMGMGPRGMGGMGCFGGMPVIVGIPVIGGRGMLPGPGPGPGPGHGADKVGGLPGLDQDGDDGDESEGSKDPADDPAAHYAYRLDENRRRW